MAVALDFDAVIPRGPAPGRARVGGVRRREGLAAPASVCVLATPDAALRRRLAAAAELAGWDVENLGADGGPIPADARLLVVDLASLPQSEREAIDRIVAEFVSRSGSLLVVCGAVGSVEHEAWARSRGAFVHVPGVAAGDSLVGWFLEARIVCDRPRSTPLPSPHRSPARACA